MSSIIQKLNHQKAHGSSHFHADPPDQQERQGILEPSMKRRPSLLTWFTNPFDAIRLLRKSGEAETSVQYSRVESEQEKEVFRNQAATAAAKYGVQSSAIVVEDRANKRAQRAIRASGAHEAVDVVDAIGLITLHFDTTITNVNQTVKDDVLREKCIAEIRLIQAQQVTEFRIGSYGLKNKLRDFSYDENI